jgi:CMP-N,N'-diacetyllegionaminic acid synthase
MYQQHKIIATICARGGSRGIPGKNIKLLAGKPLLQYSVESAKNCKLIDRIVLSTDDEKIKAVAQKLGITVPFLRPRKLATDKASRRDAVAHAVKMAEKYWQENYDLVVDLGNVSPLRSANDISKAIKQLVNTPRTNLVFSVCQANRNPYFNMVELNKRGFAKLVKPTKKFTTRQSSPQVYDMNDAIFAMWKKALFKYKTFYMPNRRIFVMPRKRSIDIDNPLDFAMAEFLISQAYLSI